jgi:hypothetical protein
LLSALDDGIVVVEVRNEDAMQRLRVVPALRQRLGDDGSEALTDMVFTASQEWRDDVLAAVESRFETRLTKEISTLRVEVTQELSSMRVEILRWSFVFWLSQVGVMAGLLAYFR